jgi:DNA invertase Pin-like site-specific DNA recombinase
MTFNGMHESETLKKDIFQAGPKALELQIRMESMLAQFSPETKSQKVQEAFARITRLKKEIGEIAGETREGLVDLYAETVIKTRLSEYNNQVAILEAHQRSRVANLLGASNEDIFTQTA